MTFDVKLKELRKNYQLTQAELADALGLKRATITQYEAGRISPSKDVLIKTANYFRVTVDELVEQGESNDTSASLPVLEPSPKGKSKTNYSVSIRNTLTQKIMLELLDKNQDSFIRDNKALYSKLIDTLLEINVKAEESQHNPILLDSIAEELDLNRVILAFSKELHKIEKLSNLF